MTIDLNRKKALLEDHLEQYWSMILSNPARHSSFLPYLERWKAVYSILLNDERFLYLAVPVTKDSRFQVSQYYMRYDGVFCFMSSVYRDGSGRELLCANPLRFPYDPNAPRKIPPTVSTSKRWWRLASAFSLERVLVPLNRG